MAMPLPLGEVQRVVAMANGNLALGASLVAIGFVNPQSIFWVFGGQYSSSVGVVDVGPIMTALHANNAAIINDAATQGCVLQILFYLRQIASDSANKVLVNGGFVSGTEAAKKESCQDKTRDGYNELGTLLLRDIPRSQRIDPKFYAPTLLSVRLGEIARILQDPESATYEGKSAIRGAVKETKLEGGGVKADADGVKPDTEGGANCGIAATQVLGYLSLIEDVILFILSIGCRVIAPHPSTPNARSIIEEGQITQADGTAVVWELTPAAAYFLIDYLRRGATGRSLPEVRHFYGFVIERISNHLDIGRNLASAFRKGGETAAAATIYAMYVPPKLEWRDAQKIDKKTPRKDTPGLKRTADRTPGRAWDAPMDNFCDRFQTGTCASGATCRFRHICRRCLREGHGEYQCRKGRERSRERSRDRDHRPRRRDEGRHGDRRGRRDDRRR